MSRTLADLWRQIDEREAIIKAQREKIEKLEGQGRAMTEPPRNGAAFVDTDDVAERAPTSKRFTVERHGKGWAIYEGRSDQRHGLNLGYLTECDQFLPPRIEELLNAHGWLQ
jgi:hypothetical protein